MTVVGAISRKGNVIARTVDEMGFTTLSDFVAEAVSTKAKMVATDEHAGYRHLRGHGFFHKTVNHSPSTSTLPALFIRRPSNRSGRS